MKGKCKENERKMKGKWKENERRIQKRFKIFKIKLAELKFYPPNRISHYNIDLRCEKAEELS